MKERDGKDGWYWGSYDERVLRLRLDEDRPQVSSTDVQTKLHPAIEVLTRWLGEAMTEYPDHDIWITLRVDELPFMLKHGEE